MNIRIMKNRFLSLPTIIGYGRNVGMVLLVVVLLGNCKPKTDPMAMPHAQKPEVSVVGPVKMDLVDSVQFNGQVVYLNRTHIYSPISGYLNGIFKKIGDYVTKGELLFTLQTREGEAFQHLGIADSLGLGITRIFSPTSGYITSLYSYEAPVFIAEGSLIASIVKDDDFLVQVNVPFEQGYLMEQSGKFSIQLSDKRMLSCRLYRKLPRIEQQNQTQTYYLKVNSGKILPENLNVIVRVSRTLRKNVVALPKEALLTNETLDKWWIMKLGADSMAIKVPVVKGAEASGWVEIVSPALSPADLIIRRGAYGLPDSTKVTIR